MSPGDVVLLRGQEVQAALAGQEKEVLRVVRRAYELHGGGDTSLPHSVFLRFPSQPTNRIIALPAYLGGGFATAGLKWISSFPGNLQRDLDRASAVIVLNSPDTGHPETIMEGSIVSAKRTAASAALAARSLKREGEVVRVGLIGCGRINFEVLRFLLVVSPGIANAVVFDIDRQRAVQFLTRCRSAFSELSVTLARDYLDVIQDTSLISIATTTASPYLNVSAPFVSGSLVLHISLRDLTP